MNEHQVIVVGVGAMGSSVCRHLARRRVRVVGIERHGVPNDRGSSHGGSRAIRLAYYEHPDYVPLLRRAYELWHEIEGQAGEALLSLTGGLYLGPADSELVQGSLASARRHGLPHELLEAGEIARRYPPFRLPTDWLGFYEPNAGVLRPEASVAAMAGQAVDAGAEIHDHERVIAWGPEGDGFVVRTDQGEYRCDTLVLTQGAWAGPVLSELGVELTVTRQAVGWVEPDDPTPFLPGAFPLWALMTPSGDAYYGMPMDPTGLKMARHGGGKVVDPDAVDRTVTEADRQSYRPVAEYLPAANATLKSMSICLYENSPDHHFIIDRHPQHPNLVLACGFSGHGFKFASVVGEIVADLVQQGETRHPIGFLRLDRFPA